MDSPFPGMDPYTERADIWPELHNPIMTYARDALQPLLPEGYVARLELRIYTEREPEGRAVPARIPDLELVKTGSGANRLEPESGEARSPYEGEGYWVSSVPRERREARVVVRTVPDSELVTVIELLSPSNKRPGIGREKYLTKQREMLDAGVNLLEVDLLRSGLHTIAVDERSLQGLPSWDYLMCANIAARPWDVWVRPWTVRDPIPQLPVPLAPGAPSLRLDLQSIYARAYRNAACRKLIDYQRNPEPSLRTEDHEWLDTLLQRAGLRNGDGTAADGLERE